MRYYGRYERTEGRRKLTSAVMDFLGLKARDLEAALRRAIASIEIQERTALVNLRTLPLLEANGHGEIVRVSCHA